MSEPVQQVRGEIIVASRNAIAEAIVTLGDMTERVVTVYGDDDPEGSPRERLALRPPTERDAVVVADHDAPEAYDLLREALSGPAGYVAMLASRTRSADVLALLAEEGFEEQALERLHMPAGLDIGGRLPGEIALSVVAEIVAWSNGRSGRPMRDAGARQIGASG